MGANAPEGVGRWYLCAPSVPHPVYRFHRVGFRARCAASFLRMRRICRSPPADRSRFSQPPTRSWMRSRSNYQPGCFDRNATMSDSRRVSSTGRPAVRCHGARAVVDGDVAVEAYFGAHVLAVDRGQDAPSPRAPARLTRTVSARSRRHRLQNYPQRVGVPRRAVKPG